MIILEYNASLFCVSREGPTLQQMPRVGGGGGWTSTHRTSLRSFPGTQMSSDLWNWIGPILTLSLHSFPGIFVKQHGLWFCEAVNLAALQEISRETWKMPDCKFSIYFYWMLGPHQTVVSFKIAMQPLMQTFIRSKSHLCCLTVTKDRLKCTNHFSSLHKQYWQKTYKVTT